LGLLSEGLHWLINTRELRDRLLARVWRTESRTA